MQLSIKSVGGARIEGDLSGLTELRDLLAEVIDQGHGLGSDGTLPAVTLLDAKGKPVLPARKVKIRGDARYRSLSPDDLPMSDAPPPLKAKGTA